LFAMPLLRPLQRREEIERTRTSDLTSMATDIVAGLRILRGIGGEQTFARNYTDQSQWTRQSAVSAGVWQGAVDATGVLFSGLFLVALTWLGAGEVVAGDLSVGQLISFFGYAIFMVWPIQTFFELAQKWVRSGVSARKTVAVLGQQPPWHASEQPLTLPDRGVLHDQESGFVGQPGEFTIIVSALPDDSAALADRLGRYLPADHDPVSLEVAEGLKGRAARRARKQQRIERAELAERDRQLAGQKWGVSLGTVDLADVPIDQVRQRIVVSDTASQVFAGTLQSAIDPHGRLSLDEAETVLRVAAAEDVFTGSHGGWQGRIDERGRGLSGGQRQRVVLARVLGLDPQILILVEPTSAVDAHTEALIAERLVAHRRGKTTIVTTVSPLLLHHADRVAFLFNNRIAAYGTHEELLRTNPDYRRTVARALDEPAEGSDG
jgi:ABC-type multidrug transport system fused ATPase/permease subunit